MRRLSLLCLALALLACGGPTGPEPDPDPTGPPSLAIVSGDGQEVVVEDTLPFDAVVQVMRGGEPVADQLVDWRVLEDNAGEPFVTTTRTDSTGTVKNRVIAGTRAFTHPDIDGSAHMEVRWVEQSSGDAIVDTTITFRVLPGVATDTMEQNASAAGIPPYTTPGGWLVDQYGNPVPYRWTADSIVSVQGDTVGEDGRTLVLNDGASLEDEAIICAWDAGGGLLFPGYVSFEGSATKDTHIRVEVAWDSNEPESDIMVPRSACL